MATDGVKIINGDLAHDTYWGIMDLYDNNAAIKTIKEQFPLIKDAYLDKEDFYHEIFVTAYALAFWEIGQMSDEILNEVKSVIEKGACVKVWTEEYHPKDGKARQRELDKLWKKISQQNIKIRPRKKYRQITNLYFQADDVLTFKLKDTYYRAVICTGIYQYRGRCEYVFVPTTFKGHNKPSVEDLLEYQISGTRIGSGYDKETTLSIQQGVDVFWKLFPEKMDFMPTPPHFFIGLAQDLISHKDIINFKDIFEKIGILKIKDSFKRAGSSGWVADFERFVYRFENVEVQTKTIRHFKFPIRLLCET